MLHRSELPVCLGFLCEIAAPGAKRAEFEFLRELGELTGSDSPIHWFFPPRFFEESDEGAFADLVRVMKDRLSHGSDRLVAMGYRDAFHPLLGLKEIDRDVRWSAQNPWKRGIERYLGQSPTAIYPTHPDLGRPGVLDLYAEAGFEDIGILYRPQAWSRYSLVWREAKSSMRLFSILAASRDTLRDLQGAESKRAGISGAMILFDSTFVRRGAVKSFLRRLDRRYAVRLTGLRDVASSASAVTPGELAAMAAAPLPGTLTSRAAWLAAEPLRRSTKKAEQRALLEIFSDRPPADRDLRPPEGRIEVCRREQSSMMQGRVSLPGPRFDARFEDGLLCGFERDGVSLFPLAPLKVCVHTGVAMRAATTESATSFGDDLDRGLRTVLAAPGASIVIDYRFTGSCGALLVDVTATYTSAGPSLRAIVPFGLAVDLARAEAPVTLRAFSDSGFQDWPADTPGPEGRVQEAAGSSFVLRAGGAALSISFPPQRGLAFRPLQWSILGRPPPRVLVLNPLGSFHPHELQSYAGLQEGLTISLDPVESARKLPAAVVKSSLRHRVLRTPPEPLI